MNKEDVFIIEADMEKLNSAMKVYLECSDNIKKEQSLQSEAKAIIDLAMQEFGTNKIETEIGTATRINGSTSPKFDVKALVALMMSSQDIRKVLSPHMGETVRKPSIAIKRK